MRIIIRFSVDGGGDLRNKLAGHLAADGFRQLGTATWENNLAVVDLHTTLSEFWKRVATHSPPGTLDHFWMYADQ